jgi:hypothetical protein
MFIHWCESLSSKCVLIMIGPSSSVIVRSMCDQTVTEVVCLVYVE